MDTKRDPGPFFLISTSVVAQKKEKTETKQGEQSPVDIRLGLTDSLSVTGLTFICFPFRFYLL